MRKPSDEVIQANLSLHAEEARVYDQIHHEIFNPIEQSRINSRLRRATDLLHCEKGWALDFGAGTGNIALKLTNLGFKVVASDLSEEMLTVLREKPGADQVEVIVGEGVSFKREKFSLVTVCSVLHHLPDYVAALSELAQVLKLGGVLFIDHEADSDTPFYSPGKDYLAYIGSSSLINAAYRKILGVERPYLDYEIADFHCRPEDHVDWREVTDALESSGMAIQETRPYLLHRATMPNPLYPVFALWLVDYRYLIARREK